MKTLSLILICAGIMTLLSFQAPVQTQEEEYLPIDTTLGGVEAVEVKNNDFDSEF